MGIRPQTDRPNAKGSRMIMVPRQIRDATQPTDFIKADRLLSEEEKGIRDRVREFVGREVIPTAADYWDRAEFPFELVPALGELGIAGGSFGEEYGCAGWNNVAYGLAIAAVARGSGSLATFLHLHTIPTISPVHELGS